MNHTEFDFSLEHLTSSITVTSRVIGKTLFSLVLLLNCSCWGAAVLINNLEDESRPSTTTLPSPFSLLAPADGGTGISECPVFRWEDSTNETGYIIEIGIDSSFSTPPFYESPILGEDTTHFPLVPGIVLNGTTYYWRVRALNNDGQTITPIHSFTPWIGPFAKSYGKPGGLSGYSVRDTVDGGYIIGGQSGGADGWIAKLYPDASIEWEITLSDQFIYSISFIWQLPDEGFIAGGRTSAGAGLYDVWMIRLDASGGIVWQKAYGGAGTESNPKFAPTADGNFVCLAKTNSFVALNHLWIFKIDLDGNLLWQQDYGSITFSFSGDIQETAAGDFIACGYQSNEPLLLKINSTGSILWQKVYTAGQAAGISVYNTSDGGIFLAAQEFGVVNDTLAIKLTSTGSVSWTKQYLSPGGEIPVQTIESNDGGLLILTRSENFGAGSFDFWLLKFDSSGTELWQKTYGGVLPENPYGLHETSDGSLLITGDTASFGTGGDCWFLKTDPMGTVLPAVIGVDSAIGFISPVVTEGVPSPLITQTGTLVVPLNTNATGTVGINEEVQSP